MDSSDQTRIAFFDVETTIPTQTGEAYAILEFAAIQVCSKKLVELHTYSTLVRPPSLSLITPKSIQCNGITPEAVSSAPTFAEIADQVYSILHGRIWAGHNILRFDCLRIREAFRSIGRPSPEPSGTIDSLRLLTEKFGRRAGDMKMASIANYFGLGQQTHRSLDDVRMNIKVVKYCATVLFLESGLSNNTFASNGWVSPNTTTTARSHKPPTAMNGKNGTSNSRKKLGIEAPPSSSSSSDKKMKRASRRMADPVPFDMGPFRDEMKATTGQKRPRTDGFYSPCEPPHIKPLQRPASVGSTSSAAVLAPDEISIPLLKASLVPYYRVAERIALLHNGVAFQLFFCRLRVRQGVVNFGDGGKPRFSLLVDATSTICQILDACDNVAQKLSAESASSSGWRPIVNRKCGQVNTPTVRMHIQTTNVDGGLRYETEIYKKQPWGDVEKLRLSQCNAEELDGLIRVGAFVDVYFSLESYDYNQIAGIRAVLNKLVLWPSHEAMDVMRFHMSGGF
ncbi:hypothetical protein SAY87_003923 [Trapa incisa]|uniref:Exonuclease domain-containing protein n=1 Tax=Trapa incisa TaxID=236973 RepID=A0AAN7JN10_9MYRT|nr:hypothetical protein SAY87_003923 [Trapa incisa]